MKKNFKLATVLLLALILSSCENYLGGFIGSGLGGLLAYPFQRLVEAFQDGTDDFYQRVLRNRSTRESDAALRLLNRCINVNGVTLPDDFAGLSLALQNRACLGCVPWGVRFECSESETPATEQNLKDHFLQNIADPNRVDQIFSDFPNLAGNCCSSTCETACDRMCPESAELLAQGKKAATPFRENTLPIDNFGISYGHCYRNGDRVSPDPATCNGSGEVIERPTAFNGVCHGHATVRHNIATLAQWAPNEVPKDRQGREITNTDALTQFYADILEDLAEGKVRKVPGYSNVRDFTNRPDMATALRTAIFDQFHAQVRTNPFLVESLSVTGSLTAEKYRDQATLINQNIELTGRAQVTFGLGGASGHTVEIYKTLETVDGNNRPITIMCSIDSNQDICMGGTGTRYTPCASGYNDFTPEAVTKGAYDMVDGVYCPRRIIVYRDTFEFDFPNVGLVKGKSFDVDRQQDRTVRSNILELTEYCKNERGCR